MINLFDNNLNQPSKFRTKKWVEINDDSRGTNTINSEIKFKTLMLKTSLFDYSDAYMLAKGNITVPITITQQEQVMLQIILVKK